MARRRFQQKGELTKSAGWWMLRWREDAIGEDGVKKRVWHPQVCIGPCEGPNKFTEKEARRIGWELHLSRLDQNTLTPQSIMTVVEFVKRKFIPERVFTLKRGGKMHYETQLKRILPAFGEMRLRDVKVEHVQRFVASIITSGRSTQTALHAKNAVSAIFEHAIDAEMYVGRNPARAVRMPEMERKELHALSFEQCRLLLNTLPETVRNIALCGLLTSMNVSEICGLQWKHVNLTDEWATSEGKAIPPRTLVVRRHWYRRQASTLKKTARKRIIPIPAVLHDVLAKMATRPKWTGPDDPVFASRKGTPVNDVNISARVLRPVGKSLGMPWLGWHVLRRSTATFADFLGLGTADRKGLLGHDTNEMAAHYVQGADLERRRAVLEKIADMIAPAPVAGKVVEIKKKA